MTLTADLSRMFGALIWNSRGTAEWRGISYIMKSDHGPLDRVVLYCGGGGGGGGGGGWKIIQSHPYQLESNTIKVDLTNTTHKIHCLFIYHI